MSIPAFIYDAVRTPRGKGKKDGSLHEVKPVDLMAGLLQGLQKRHDLDTSRVDDFIMGCVVPVGEQGTNMAKIAPMVAGWDQGICGMQLDRYCASALEAVGLAVVKVMAGWEELVVAGGVESMSRVKMGSAGGPWSDDPATSIASGFIPQGIGADLIASLEKFSREDVDQFALESQKKAVVARDNGLFDQSVIPVTDENGLTILARDEFIKPNTTMEGLARLKPSFALPGKLGFDNVALAKYPRLQRINHVHHAGNSSGIVDGASAVLIGNEQVGKDLGLTPKGRVVATTVVGSEPTIMLTGPIVATKKVLKIAGMTMDDIDLVEVNEAFAAVPMKFQRDMNVPWEKINVNGGAIAMGHPLGATGAMLLSTLLDELENRSLKYGLVTLCAGAGIGIAGIIERV
ncbi:acetyl-CoA C-acetyltransferase [Desulfocicer vacuolatum DSM 3385]|uniref:Acetyl-CoA C-acetyltransferase n=1 Tax=Desulfocicer vacuolatum DSM 3385 TaxID=1121400 RepID=A0A1W2EKR0_9BACT|nr:acetyl-CoA C-acetyltransferase [Desulfocicer vacuolatum]SMD09738.1 acetyl-CoA C-acetyltransferase [Desulfocicer vacuolatum DSM 3385]